MSSSILYRLLFLPLLFMGLTHSYTSHSKNSISSTIEPTIINKQLKNSIKEYILFHKVNIKPEIQDCVLKISPFEIEEADDFSPYKKTYRAFQKDCIHSDEKNICSKKNCLGLYNSHNFLNKPEQYLYLQHKVLRI